MKIKNICGIDFEEYNGEYFSDRPIKLNVYCITYNHREYIRDCLEGVVNQITDFEFEVVIFDDASTDGTSDIIREYCNKYPQLIHAFIAKENSYINPVRYDLTLEFRKNILRGEYVAFCEGDDCWTDVHKLQIQMDILQSQPDVSLTVHNGYKVNHKTRTKELMVNYEEDRYVPVPDLLSIHNGMFPTASLVGKKEIFYESFFLVTSFVQDWPIMLYASTIGDVYYISKPMCIYNYLIEQSWSSNYLLNQEKKLSLIISFQELINRFNSYTQCQFEDAVKRKRALLWAAIIDILFLPEREYLQTINNAKKLKYFFENWFEYYEKIDLIRSHLSSVSYLSFNMGLALFLKQFCGRKIYVFCASSAGERMNMALKAVGMEVECFVDNAESKNGSKFLNKKVISFNALKNQILSDKVILVASLDYDVQIVKQLQSLKDCYFISAMEFYEHFFAFDK